MLQRLGRKFWTRLASFLLLLGVISQGKEFFRPTAEDLTFSDEISTGAAHADAIMPDSGLTVSVEQRVDQFLTELKSQPSQPEKWHKLNEEWLGFARSWFERVYPGQELFNRYTSLWVGKREKIKLWRLNCRNDFFPDMSDEELLMKAEWLQNEEEWQEMQAKINRGLESVESEYQAALKEMLGEHIEEFNKLHGLFVKDFLPKETVLSSTYFL